VAYYSHTGSVSGAEIDLLQILAALRETEPLVLCAVASELGRRLAAAGIRTQDIADCAPRMSATPLQVAKGTGSLLRAAAQLGGRLRRERVDLVHANSIRAGLVASLAKPIHRQPVIWHLKDFLPANAIGRLIRRVGERADWHIAISEAVRRDFCTRPRLLERASTIHLGTPLDGPPREPGRLRAELELGPLTPLVGVVGQIAPWKRHEDVIRALAIVRRDVPDAHLVVDGSAKFRPENAEYATVLRRLVGNLGLEEVVFFRDHAEAVHRVYDDLDVLVLASIAEPFGLVLIEAMARGVPVVATSAGGVPEIVEHGVQGLLVPPGNPAALAAALRAILGDGESRKRMGAAGRERVTSRFTVTREVAEIERVYRAVLVGRE
jgi:glycosyltransferase involved in cell wall biosynthesis